jgi:DNA-binding response OmpR family regulator
VTMRVAVLCWEESRPWVSALRQSGFSVPWVEEPKGEVHRQVAGVEADLLVIDLTRLPQQGIDMLGVLADEGTLQGVPVVAVTADGSSDGLSGKLDSLTVTTPPKMISAVEAALAQRSKA